eukprot:TRINITY_DN3056_c0_g1_i2.p1 TRINITY_DN3056_c0_g1~~TRINITY_DN3056_c0_g1_i2.p1  ORF type:complete len:228 (+),score=44.50 TRINITY_DN3056_c0_g1_i2:30-686(+)
MEKQNNNGDSSHKLNYALDLMRRLPFQDSEKNLSYLLDLVPEISEDLLCNVEQSLKIAHDKKSKRDYLLCDYNRDGDSYRSPWSNTYFPSIRDGTKPSKQLRELEVQVNEAFDIYRELYYEGGVSSVYFWDLEDEPDFGGCILFKKSQDQTKRGQPMKGLWDSMHVLEVIHTEDYSAKYNLTSTVILQIKTKDPDTGNVEIGGTLTRQVDICCFFFYL